MNYIVSLHDRCINTKPIPSLIQIGTALAEREAAKWEALLGNNTSHAPGSHICIEVVDSACIRALRLLLGSEA